MSQDLSLRDGHSCATALDYADLIAMSGDVTTVVDRSGRYLYCSVASEEVFGWAPDQLVGRREDDFVHPDDAPALAARRERGSPCVRFSTVYRFRCRNGSYLWVEATSRGVATAGGDVTVNTVRDITERQRHAAALERRASTDPLTGVANRAVLIDRLQQGLRRLDRSRGTVLAVLYLDLDRFKVINDSLGHHIGDDVLLKIAGRLTQHLRPADTLARLGGDEFVIVAEGVTNDAAAVALANRVIEDCRRPFLVTGEEISCTISIGVACTADSQRHAEELLYEADLALYRAKGRGRDQSGVFDEELRTTAVDRLATERMLRHALSESRIVVEYQPVVGMKSDCPIGAEALVRIRDTNGGLRLPASFLGVAEETGLLVPMDTLVLADAVQQAETWRRRLGEGFAWVSVNVTARHLANSEFRRLVVDQLEEHGVPPQDLQVEVTEQVLMEASNSAMTGLRALRDLGVKVGLDDFGVGYSSLAYLHQFPLDFIKIDKSFVDDLATDSRVRAIVAAVIVLAHALDLTVVAEGVELPGQHQVLLDLGCDKAQGFLYAPAGAPDVIEHLVRAGKPTTFKPRPPAQVRRRPLPAPLDADVSG